MLPSPRRCRTTAEPERLNPTAATMRRECLQVANAVRDAKKDALRRGRLNYHSSSAQPLPLGCTCAASCALRQSPATALPSPPSP